MVRNISTGTLAICAALGIVFGGVAGSADELGSTTADYDIVIYGGTSAAVTAAVQSRRMGCSIIVVSPDKHIGGLTSGGLGWTDSGKKEAVGGLAREFYQQVFDHYEIPTAWRQQSRSEYGDRAMGQPGEADGKQTMWVFEPHVAEQILDQWLAENDVPVERNERLDRDNGVRMDGNRIVSIRTLAGKTYSGRFFIDATYEGDLMAAAGVSYAVGREPNSQYDETYNGNQVGVLHHQHYFTDPIDPYRVPGQPGSGLLPRISPSKPGIRGTGDDRIQAYCFRMCLTNARENRIPFTKPLGYDRDQYELLARLLNSGWDDVQGKFDPLPNHKTDTNNHGPFSTDNIGMNYDYPNADYEMRDQIITDHETYQKGLMYFLSNDESVPQSIRDQLESWGLSADEFIDNDHWPHQLYIREARRMIGQYVMTEKDVLNERPTPDPIGLGSYAMDSHNVRRYVSGEGTVQNEGDIGVSPRLPYEIAYGSIVPKSEECRNLLVPVCVSSSHIAFGSIRMEPVFMTLGQSAATAAALCLRSNRLPGDLPYSVLRQRLLRDEQRLDWPADPRAVIGQLNGIVIDDRDAQTSGWIESTATGPYWRTGYRHNGGNADRVATYSTDIGAGRYEIRVSYTPHENRSKQVRYDVETRTGTKSVFVDQTEPIMTMPQMHSIGEFELGPRAIIKVQSTDPGGYAVVDAVQFLSVH